MVLHAGASRVEQNRLGLLDPVGFKRDFATGKDFAAVAQA